MPVSYTHLEFLREFIHLFDKFRIGILPGIIDADLLILLSDIDGLYTDDPRQNPNAEFIEQVDELIIERDICTAKKYVRDFLPQDALRQSLRNFTAPCR